MYKGSTMLARRIQFGIEARGFYFLLDQEILPPHCTQNRVGTMEGSLRAIARANGWRLIDSRNCCAHLFLSTALQPAADANASFLHGLFRGSPEDNPARLHKKRSVSRTRKTPAGKSGAKNRIP